MSEVIITTFTQQPAFESVRQQFLFLLETYPHVAVLLALMLLDVVTGTLAAAVSGTLASNVSYRGHLRKGIILCILGASRLMEFIIPGAPLLLFGSIGFCAYEVWSIIENAGRAGVPLPPKLKRAFEIFREEQDYKDAQIVVRPKPHSSHNNRDSDIVIETRNHTDQPKPPAGS